MLQEPIFRRHHLMSLASLQDWLADATPRAIEAARAALVQGAHVAGQHPYRAALGAAVSLAALALLKEYV